MAEPINLFGKLQTEAEELLGALPINSASGSDDEGVHFGFSPRMIEDTLRRLYAHTRIDMFLRIAHFIAAADLSGLNVCDLIFGIAPYKDEFRAAFLAVDKGAARLSLHEDAVYVEFDGGQSFRTYFSSTPKTVCAANIACLFLGADDLTRRIADIQASSNSADALFGIAKSWANDFDRYLRKREGSGHEARAFQEIILFLNKIFPQGRFTHRDVTSKYVLDFWRQNAGRDDFDMRLYSTTHANFSNFAEAYAAYGAQLAERDAVSILAPIEEGGATEDILTNEGWPVETSNYEDWVALQEETREIKFLLAKQQKLVEDVANLAPEAETLLLSAVRAAVFGEIENRLVEAKRRKMSSAEIEAISHETPSLDYDALLAAYFDTAADFKTAVLASAYILIANRREDGLQLLMETSPELRDEETLAQIIRDLGLSVEKIREEGFARLVEGLYRELFESDRASSPFVAAFDKAEAAWKANNRNGFRRAQLYEEECVAAHEMAANRLLGAFMHLNVRLRKLKKALSELPERPGAFDADASIFKDMFFKLHVSAANE